MQQKVIDVFILYDELNMLNYRLETLEHCVDYFVLVESTHTFNGLPKILHYNNNKSRFSKFLHKIVHIIVDDFPHKIDNSLNANGFSDGRQWENELFQRERSIPRGLKRIPNLHPDDYVICSDIDEIVNPSIIQDIQDCKIIIGDRHSLEMDMYYYNLTNYVAKWNAPCLQRVKCVLETSVKKPLDTSGRWSYTSILPNAGWHLSYFGDSSVIQNKLKHFGHQEYNKDEYTNETHINAAIKSGTDLFNRDNVTITKIEIKDNPNLPPRLDLLAAFLG